MPFWLSDVEDLFQRLILNQNFLGKFTILFFMQIGVAEGLDRGGEVDRREIVLDVQG